MERMKSRESNETIEKKGKLCIAEVSVGKGQSLEFAMERKHKTECLDRLTR
jgi:predicted metal-dependent RNase